MKKILLVNDDSYIINWKRFLEEAGYKVVLCMSDLKACQDIEEGLEYDLAIIDLELGRLGGDEVMRISKEKNPNVHVWSISSYGSIPKISDKHLLPSFPDDVVDKINEYFKGIEYLDQV